MKTKRSSDLLGAPIRARRPAFEAVLERRDNSTRADRASRVRWLKKTIHVQGFGMQVDSFHVFDEATSTFVDGYFIATVILAAAFAEHWMSGILHARGFAKEASGGLGSCIRCGRRAQVWPEFILDRLEHLRKIRNPFVHLKDFEHEHSLTQRSWMRGREPADVAEADAKHALETLFAMIETHAR